MKAFPLADDDAAPAPPLYDWFDELVCGCAPAKADDDEDDVADARFWAVLPEAAG